jgi:nucleoside-diphosphate-sugar epimerase
MKVLFIGGTGLISTAVSHVAVNRGIDLTVLNRGTNNEKLPDGITFIKGDIKNEAQIKNLLNDQYFDAIVQWISFTIEDVQRDVRLFKGHTKQFVFISSASAYKKPLPFLPVTEKMPLDNPYWTYSKNKQLCEEYLLQQQTKDFKVTIIRPSHTYDDHSLISQLKSNKYPYTMLNRMKQGKPIIIPDDGMQLWTLTYNYDFAEGFVDILGNKKTYGKYYHLTSDKVYTWERIHEMIAQALGVPMNIVYIPWDYIFKYFPEFKPEILGDKQKSLVFDNKKIKKVAKHYKSETDYGEIVKRAIQYYENNKEVQVIDEEFDHRYDELITAYSKELK